VERELERELERGRCSDVSAGAFDMLVAGHPSLDIMFSGLQQWPELGRDVDAAGAGVCAGTSFNTPAAANRLGLRVGYISMIGDDVWSRLVREEFDAEQLPTDFLRMVDRPLPFVSVALNFGSDRGFVTYEGSTPDDERELERFAVEVVSSTPARHLHAYAGEEPSELGTIAHERGMTVSMDAWGGPWWDGPAPKEDLLPRADVFLANEPEALAITGEADPDAALACMAELCACVVIKRGAQGAIGATGGEVSRVAAEPANVVDTTGAGDCFNAGFLRGWLAGLGLEESLTLGNICGGKAVEAFGGYRGCPREAELRTLAGARGIALP
jgi:sugar/nucleoside kinase (ribokinase family)